MAKSFAFCSVPASSFPGGNAFEGPGSFSSPVLDAHARLFICLLASHPACTREFIPVRLPLTAVLGPDASSRQPREVNALFGRHCPLFTIEEGTPAGRRLKNGAYTFFHLFVNIVYHENEEDITATLNPALIPYLPQLLSLLPPGLLAGLPWHSAALQLA